MRWEWSGLLVALLLNMRMSLDQRFEVMAKLCYFTRFDMAGRFVEKGERWYGRVKVIN